MEGKTAHTWRPPYRPGLYGYLLDNGHLFYGGKIMDDLGPLRGVAALQGRRGARDRLARPHSPGAPPPRPPSRRAPAPQRERAPAMPGPPARAIAAQVRGGLPGTEADGKITPTISSR